MNPVIVIPTFVSGRHQKENKPILQTYDHMTPISRDGELLRCLQSINEAQGNVPVIILVVADPGLEKQAPEKVQMLANQVPGLQTLVVGIQELELCQQRFEQLGLGKREFEIGLSSYGATRNLGLVVAAVFGFDAVVFVDDDVLIEDPEFLKKAVYGLGKFTSKGIPIIAKSGYYLDKDGSYLAKTDTDWCDKSWDQGKLFNEWINKAMKAPRLSRSNTACGGCMALHREAFRRLSFDPWITRGEDLDYLLNLRMYGSTVWFDNAWNLRHLPPEETISEGLRFHQDIYRWLYEFRKLEYSRTQIDLMQVKPSSLMPYPGPFLESSIMSRIKITARKRSLGRSDRRAYNKAAMAASKEAAEYATENCAHYFEFQSVWPRLMQRIENDTVLRRALVQSTSRRKGIDLGEINMAQAIVDEAAAAANAAAAAAAASLASQVAAVTSAVSTENAPAQEQSPETTAEFTPISVAQASGYDLDDAAGIWVAAETGQMPEGKDLVPLEFDPGMTSEIRLNLQD